MKKWLMEDWNFTVTVLAVGPDGDPVGRCRMGFEPGDRFTCRYDCPAGFCPKSMFKLHALCDAMRAGGDMRLLGGEARGSIRFSCADGPVTFLLEGRQDG
ncbi:MAG: TIGR04076 family protein [Clostridiales bacterium]|nr:TIGR04076 family protein [Clostridiales bacterium]